MLREEMGAGARVWVGESESNLAYVSQVTASSPTWSAARRVRIARVHLAAKRCHGTKPPRPSLKARQHRFLARRVCVCVCAGGVLIQVSESFHDGPQIKKPIRGGTKVSRSKVAVIRRVCACARARVCAATKVLRQLA